jgi:hypothetical protein
MTKTSTGLLALAALLLAETAVQAGEVVVPFHTTLTVSVGCSSPTAAPQCAHLEDWLATCQAQGYDSGFQAVRTGYASLMGRVTSFEQGCLDFAPGPASLVRSYVQLTLTARNGDTLTSFAVVLFDFAQAGVPATGTFSITGGTGRFFGARGTGTVGSVTDEGDPGLVIQQDGSLRLARGGH